MEVTATNQAWSWGFELSGLQFLGCFVGFLFLIVAYGYAVAFCCKRNFNKKINLLRIMGSVASVKIWAYDVRVGRQTGDGAGKTFATLLVRSEDVIEEMTPGRKEATYELFFEKVKPRKLL